MSSIAGELVTERLVMADGGRRVTVYVPPAPAEAVVFTGDGQLISQWSESVEAADVPLTMIVGVHRLSDETLRLHEYSPGFEPERFAAHEKFFVEDVRGWVRARFGVGMPAERTAVFGVSAGGHLLPADDRTRQRPPRRPVRRRRQPRRTSLDRHAPRRSLHHPRHRRPGLHPRPSPNDHRRTLDCAPEIRARHPIAAQTVRQTGARPAVARAHAWPSSGQATTIWVPHDSGVDPPPGTITQARRT
jgi:hypothetical protein